MNVVRSTNWVCIGFVLLIGALGGCSESTRIRSGPSAADVWVNGQAVGKTPLDYTMPRSDLDKPHEVRIEKEGYEPWTGPLQTKLAKGRVTGAFFTLGILYAFRSMYYVEPIVVALEPLPPPQSENDRALGESLRNLRELYDTGKISEEELHRRQREMLQPPSP